MDAGQQLFEKRYVDPIHCNIGVRSGVPNVQKLFYIEIMSNILCHINIYGGERNFS